MNYREFKELLKSAGFDFAGLGEGWEKWSVK